MSILDNDIPPKAAYGGNKAAQIAPLALKVGGVVAVGGFLIAVLMAVKGGKKPMKAIDLTPDDDGKTDDQSKADAEKRKLMSEIGKKGAKARWNKKKELEAATDTSDDH